MKKMTINVITIVVLVAALIWVCAKFMHLGNIEYTDNAQVRQHIVPVNSRVQGFIKEIRFEEYAQVRKGDTLAVIEDAEFVYRLRQAEADLQNALAGKTVMNSSINTVSNNISVTDAAVEEARVQMLNAEKEFARYENLLKQDAVTAQVYDAAKTEYEASKARFQRLRLQKESTALSRTELTNRLEQTDAGIALARAAVELARLNLSYTVITAPCDGTTGHKGIQVGQLIQPGQTMVDIVDKEDIWIVANYRETQLCNIRCGADVDIMVDAVPEVVFHGKVTSISEATGAAFSLIPQDNATGNFVKVEQRVPVRIEFVGNEAGDMERLRAGLNVECEVKY
ncbi:MAG: HlyD family secretion protein [Roseburia sp.]|nr:HlyD family secretion protein [Roseburia sp.]